MSGRTVNSFGFPRQGWGFGFCRDYYTRRELHPLFTEEKIVTAVARWFQLGDVRAVVTLSGMGFSHTCRHSRRGKGTSP